MGSIGGQAQVFQGQMGKIFYQFRQFGIQERFTAGDFDSLNTQPNYKNLKGSLFETLLSDILAHMVNHGSYHRGQIASLIKKSGGEPAGTDYIGYVRELDAKG